MMEDKGLISVVVPVYNAEKYLEKCLDSILCQSYKTFEIILIDDGSSDGSADICDNYAVKDARVKVEHIENQGVSHARNLGIEKASGEFVTFVDSDDYLDGNMLEDMMGAMKDDVLLCVTAIQEEQEKTAPFSIEICGENMDKIMFLHRNFIIYCPWAKLYRAQVIKEHSVQFPSGFDSGEDLMFNMDYLSYPGNISFVNRQYYRYIRDNQQSLSQKVRWNVPDKELVTEARLRQWFKEQELYTQEVREYLGRRLFDMAYNKVCLIYRDDCTWNRKEKKQFVQQVLNIPEIEASMTYARPDQYASWIVNAMRKKNIMIILMRSR